ncbi:MAG: glutamine synthetase III, partial [Thermoguttaceae bacterium]|nr:glutamine synthetase III [Thermoguttaceae bacterium]
MNENIRRSALLAIASQVSAPSSVHTASADLSTIFGKHVFNEKVQQQRLPPSVFRSLQETIKGGCPLDPSISETVASVMRDWAIERGATHFTHWFQPMTGSTAEKHDCFVTPLEGGQSL